MITDLSRFVEEERPRWSELEALLTRMETGSCARMPLPDVKRFHYLYERASAGLAKVNTFSSDPELRGYLESLVGRAYAEIHESRERKLPVSSIARFFRGFPAVFRRRAAFFRLAAAILLAGAAFGGLAVRFDPDAREALIPFEALHRSPAERVAQEEGAARDRLEGGKASFSAMLMTHNIRVSIFLLALGMTWGVGTVILLFYNGAILGAVGADYFLAGQGRFLLGWLLPHGAVEIPAILIAGQAGLLLAGALIGNESGLPVGARLRRVSDDLLSLICGASALLLWAGFVEAFLSQYHEPVLPYSLKIGFGVAEVLLLALLLGRAGTGTADREAG